MPGEKLCKGMDIDHMLSLLVENKIVNHPRQHSVHELIGEFNYLGTAYNNNEQNVDKAGNWIPQDPSMPQIRQNLTEYAILPLGSPFLRKNLCEDYMLPKTLLLYGPSGSGKTMLAQAVACHTGAMFLNLSPSNLEGKFAGSKQGPTRLMHMAFTVAKSEHCAPVVIYVDQIEQIFTKTKKGSTGAGRFKKDLVTYKKSLEREHRVIVIGCCNQPWEMSDADVKEVKAFFDRQLYVPWPDYTTRVRCVYL